MLLAAASALALAVDRRRLTQRHIIPEFFCDEVTPRIAEAVAQKAIEEGHARTALPVNEVYERTWQRLYGAKKKSY
jgi:malate dehydrogenase (oxaloacetate-decarboxylating)